MSRFRLICFLFIATSIMSLPVVRVSSSGGGLVFNASAMTFSADHDSVSQEQVGQIEALIQQAIREWRQHLDTQNNEARKSAKKNLEQAEKLLKDELKRAADCEKCYELLAATYLYQSYYGFEKDYDQCLKFAEQAAARFPNNARIALFKGYAHYYRGEYAEANIPLKAAFLSDDFNASAQAGEVLRDSMQRFLAGWNRQANFYQSKESRIDVLNPQIGAMQTVFQVTPDFELQLGAQGFAAAASQAPMITDPEIQTYLENLVSRLVSNSPGMPFNYRLTVLDSPMVNAVTTPGHIIVYTGLLAFTDNEAQLAGVLAHELGHNYGHHAARTFIKEYLARSTANALLQLINPQNRTAQILGSLGANIGLMLFSRAYGRHEEKEADHYGAHIMFNAGYLPSDASEFFLKMARQNQKKVHKYLDTHPPLQDRADYMLKYLQSFPTGGREARKDSEELQRIKSRLASRSMQQRVP